MKVCTSSFDDKGRLAVDMTVEPRLFVVVILTMAPPVAVLLPLALPLGDVELPEPEPAPVGIAVAVVVYVDP